MHDEAAAVEDTDWPQILALYELLRGISDNPMVALNHGDRGRDGPWSGRRTRAAPALDTDDSLRGHYRLAAVRGHLFEMAGERDRAVAHYRAAAERTASVPERDYLTHQGRPPGVAD